ncbi:MAG: hypothetical protein KC609_03340 [Myxococcales bacterium]|nr:hypothetical protein [Myxococcales bacterium]
MLHSVWTPIACRALAAIIFGASWLAAAEAHAAGPKNPYAPFEVRTGAGLIKVRDTRTGLEFDVPLDYQLKVVPGSKKRLATLYVTHKVEALQLRVALDRVEPIEANLPNLKLLAITLAVNRARALADYRVVNLPTPVLKRLGFDLGTQCQYLTREKGIFCCEEIWVLLRKPKWRYIVTWLWGDDHKKSAKRRELVARVLSKWRFH